MKKLLELVVKKKNRKRSVAWSGVGMKYQLAQMTKMNQRVISMSGGR